MRFRVLTRSPFLSALADIQSIPSPRSTGICALRSEALLLLPELVEPGFGCLIPLGFLEKLALFQDQHIWEHMYQFIGLKITGNSNFSRENRWFPVDVPLSQPIEFKVAPVAFALLFNKKCCVCVCVQAAHWSWSWLNSKGQNHFCEMSSVKVV